LCELTKVAVVYYWALCCSQCGRVT